MKKYRALLLVIVITASVLLCGFPVSADNIEFSVYYDGTQSERYVMGISEKATSSSLKNAVGTDFISCAFSNKYVSTGDIITLTDGKAFAVVTGDTDCDGIITANDYLHIKAYIRSRNSITLSQSARRAADISRDGTLTATDYLMLKRYFTGNYDIYAVKPEKLRVVFLDTGQSDCIYIDAPYGKCVLIDSGDLGDNDTVTDFLDSENVDEIEYAFFTHPHADHIGAADKVISGYDVKNVYMPDKTMTSAVYKRMIEAIMLTGTPTKTPYIGEKLWINGVELLILSPKSKSYSNVNCYSIVIKLTYNNIDFLFTGDAETENEKDMLSSGYSLHADVLKVGHHGSSSSTSQMFAAAVYPSVAVICCGVDNSYGHPHAETLDTLKLIGCTVYRTDLNGTITISTDGNKLEIVPANQIT